VTPFRGIRGAVQVPADTAEAIDAATCELLLAMVERNRVDPSTIVAVWFTQTADLTAAPAPASARALGWRHVPLLGAQEASVPGDLPRVVRALVLAPLAVEPAAVRHVYLGATQSLRPDLHE
jgi:chorismate mutase